MNEQLLQRNWLFIEKFEMLNVNNINHLQINNKNRNYLKPKLL